MERPFAPLSLVVPGKPGSAFLSAWRAARASAKNALRTKSAVLWRMLVARARPRSKSLALVESSSLGDRRFVSVIQFEQRRYLIGSSPASVTLLARLPDAQSNPPDHVRTVGDGGGR